MCQECGSRNWRSTKYGLCFQNSKNWSPFPTEGMQLPSLGPPQPSPSEDREQTPDKGPLSPVLRVQGPTAPMRDVAKSLRSPWGGEEVFQPSIRVRQLYHQLSLPSTFNLENRLALDLKRQEWAAKAGEGTDIRTGSSRCGIWSQPSLPWLCDGG